MAVNEVRRGLAEQFDLAAFTDEELRQLLADHCSGKPCAELIAKRYRRILEKLLADGQAPAVPPQQWRCFHCDDVFTDPAEAREHFGTYARDEEVTPACKFTREDIQRFRDIEEHNDQLIAENAKLDNDSRLWHEAEADRVKRIGNREWWQELDYREGEKLALLEQIAKLKAEASGVPASPQWQIVTEYSPARDVECWFYIVPKTPDETYYDGSGNPILGKFEPYVAHMCRGRWSALSKATHWMTYTKPDPPGATDTRSCPKCHGHLQKLIEGTPDFGGELRSLKDAGYVCQSCGYQAGATDTP